MDILLVLVLFLAAWLGGHVLDYCFNKVEKAIRPEAEEEAIYGCGSTIRALERPVKTPVKKPFEKLISRQSTHLYLVPSATARH